MQGSRCMLMVLMVLTVVQTATGGSSLQMRVTGVEDETGVRVEVNWTPPTSPAQPTLIWAALTYSSQVARSEIGNHLLEEGASSYTISEGLEVDTQYQVCVSWDTPLCPHLPALCSYFKIPRLAPPGERPASGGGLYMVLGPVNSKNITVTWGEIPLRDALPKEAKTPTRGYQLTWRRADGRVGHPGHSSNLVSSKHLIRGLIPGTRYEVCVGETLANDLRLACDFITTEEDVPGPPATEAGSCSSQAHGTHWRCDVSWNAPDKTHGRILGYQVEWKDREGYVLMESVPRGALCDPFCYHSQIVNFHPWEVCVSARTKAGRGWESCVHIRDVSGRILAFFELRVLIIIGTTLVLYRLGPTFLKALLRCCIRGLYRHVEGNSEKLHPV